MQLNAQLDHQSAGAGAGHPAPYRPSPVSVPHAGVNTRTGSGAAAGPASQFSAENASDNRDLPHWVLPEAVRRRFLEQHGPRAEIRCRRILPKSLRKALVRAELAAWEKASAQPSTPIH